MGKSSEGREPPVRQRVRLVLALSGAALAIASLTIASARSEHSFDQKLVLYAAPLEFRYVDHGRGTAADELVFRAGLTWNGKDRAGVAHGTCTGSFTGQAICDVHASIMRRGTLSARGLPAFRYPFPEVRFAVLGGTGQFHGVRGEGVAEFVRRNRVRITLSLLT